MVPKKLYLTICRVKYAVLASLFQCGKAREALPLIETKHRHPDLFKQVQFEEKRNPFQISRKTRPVVVARQPAIRTVIMGI